MIRILWIACVCLLVVSGGVYLAYKVTYPTFTHRYKLTIAIDDGGQARTGSSVIEVRWIGQPEFGDAPPFFSAIKGQAPAVDLGSKGIIFASLDHGIYLNFPNADLLAMRAFHVRDDIEGYREVARQMGRRELDARDIPLLIWLPDANDPTIARAIAPGALAEALGPGVRLSSAAIELTDDSPVVDLPQRFSWFGSLLRRQRAGELIWPDRFQLRHEMLVGEGW